MTNVRRVIETCTNVAILVVCCLFAWSYATHKTIGFGNSEADTSAHLINQTLRPIGGYSWSSNRNTLVLALRVGCSYCKASMPFYKHLEQLQQGGSLQAHLLTVMPDSQKSGSEEITGEGLTVDGLYDQPLRSLGVTATPTLLLVDTRGIVKKAWIGQLTPALEKEVVDAARGK